MGKSKLIEKNGNQYTFYIKSLYDPANTSVKASNLQTAIDLAMMKHYFGDEMSMPLRQFREWIEKGPQEYAPTSMAIREDIIRVTDQILSRYD